MRRRRCSLASGDVLSMIPTIPHISCLSSLSSLSSLSGLSGLFGLFGRFALFGLFSLGRRSVPSGTRDRSNSLGLIEADIVDVEGSFPVVAGDEEHEALDVSSIQRPLAEVCFQEIKGYGDLVIPVVRAKSRSKRSP